MWLDDTPFIGTGHIKQPFRSKNTVNRGVMKVLLPASTDVFYHMIADDDIEGRVFEWRVGVVNLAKLEILSARLG